jgi:hypothetical protein
MKADLTHRNRQIVRERIDGCTYEDLGRRYDLTRERVRGICMEAMRRGEVTGLDIRYPFAALRSRKTHVRESEEG